MSGNSIVDQPFDVINNQPESIRRKYLEGQPDQNNYPGPFQGLDPQQQQAYINEQNNAIHNYWNISETDLEDEISKYKRENSGAPNCSVNNMHNQIPMVNRNHIEEFKDPNLTNPESETGFGQIVPQFINNNVEGNNRNKICNSPKDNRLLNIKDRPIREFSHNNMVPFYGTNVTQNMANTGVPQAGGNNVCGKNTDGFANVTPHRDRLQLYTGTDEMYQHKRETGTMFSPAEGLTSWVYGTPSIRPDLDRYRQDMGKKNNESPVEKIRVGPGIATDYNVPATGGFHQYTRILPNNVNNYKANQLENRINAGKWLASNKPTSQFIHGVSTNRPKTYITQARRPTMRSKFVTNANDPSSSRVTDYNLLATKGRQTRSETEVAAGYGQFEKNQINGPNCISYSQAPVGKIMTAHIPAPSQERASLSNIRPTLSKAAAGYDSSKGGYWECKDASQGEERWDLLGAPKGMINNSETRDGVYVNYTDRGNLNPYVINVSGTVSGGGKWNPNSYQDEQRVTRKETTAFSYLGNTKGSTNNFQQTFDDLPKVTMKETNQFAYQGNLGSRIPNKIQDLPDQPKVTRKETTDFAHIGNLAGKVNSMNRSTIMGNEF